jgi:hypothetical protein
MEWFEGMYSANLSVTRTVIRQEAAGVTLKLGIDNFKASSGWLCRNGFFQCLFHVITIIVL